MAWPWRRSRSLDSLVSLVGQSVTASPVQSLVAADRLVASTEPDLAEGETPRSYFSCTAGGYLLSHRHGRIETLFVYLTPCGEYRAFRGALIAGLSARSTRADVRKALGRPTRSGEAQTVPVLGRKGAFDRYDNESLCLHFEYSEAGQVVRLITVMAADSAP